MKVLFFYTVYLVAATCVVAQEFPRDEIDISQIADELFAQPDMDLNYEDLYENLAQLLSNPIQLNKATAEDLRFLKVLSERQIENFLKFREETDGFISIYELQSIPEFELNTVYKLAPFVTVTELSSTVDKSLLKRIRKESESYFLMRYQRAITPDKGDSAGKFLGSPDKIYMRFRSSRPGDFSFGFTTEKDQGELIRWHPSANYYAMDYFSYHVQLQNKGRLKNLILGDYQSQFGQGLMLGGIFGTGKGGETITTSRRSNIGLLPHTSVLETSAMRGVGFTLLVAENLSLTGFYSNAKRDATLVKEDSERSISSFQNTGFHRNENELAKRKNVEEKNWGAVLAYKRNAIDVGIMFNHVGFNADVQHKPTAYNQFAFSGKENQNVGLYLNYTLQNVTLFGEVARSLKGGQAGTVGLLTSLASKFDVSLLYRNYRRNFYTFYSSGFAENSSTQNEQGIYWGWKYAFSRRINFSGYVDLFRFPWLRFRGYAPSEGYEWLLRLTYEPSRKVKMFVQMREELKTRNLEIDSIKLYQHAPGKKRNLVVSFDYTPHAMLRLKSRAQFSSYAINDQVTHGFAMMQDIIIDIGKLKLTARYALFETDDFDNRQYSYENDVWLAYSLPAYNGIGIRKMAILEYKFTRYVSLWIRYSHIRYQNQHHIDKDFDFVDNSAKNEIKMQLAVRF